MMMWQSCLWNRHWQGLFWLLRSWGVCHRPSQLQACFHVNPSSFKHQGPNSKIRFIPLCNGNVVILSIPNLRTVLIQMWFLIASCLVLQCIWDLRGDFEGAEGARGRKERERKGCYPVGEDMEIIFSTCKYMKHGNITTLMLNGVRVMACRYIITDRYMCCVKRIFEQQEELNFLNW